MESWTTGQDIEEHIQAVAHESPDGSGDRSGIKRADSRFPVLRNQSGGRSAEC